MAAHNQKLSDEDFIKMFPVIGAAGIAKEYGVAVENVYRRRRRIEGSHGLTIHSPSTVQAPEPSERVRRKVELKNGVIMVGSDAHYWNDVSTAHLAFVDLAKKLKPKIIVVNGDMFDGATISRHPPINWEQRPSLEDEMYYVSARLDEIKKAAPKAKRYWPVGNHDSRFESKLAASVPEYANIKGVHLKDHFPGWTPCMALWVNDEIVIKHRFKGGVHASHNNTLWAGKTMVTGHTHQQKVTPFKDYNGVRWGVECGTMAEPYGEQFMYGEDNPKQHISGFVVLTIKDGVLMHPEVVRVVDKGVYEFRGEWVKV